MLNAVPFLIKNNNMQIEIGKTNVKVIKTISEGGFGFVYLVEVVGNSSKRYALKKIITQTKEHFENANKELDFLKNHCQEGNPYFMNYIDSKIVAETKFKNVFYILVEYGANGTLFNLIADRVKANKKLTEEEIITIAKITVKDLEALHALGFAHLDIKIENLLFFSWSSIKLCDFGSITKTITDFSTVSSSEHYKLQTFYELKTTMMYRPPEICEPDLRYKVDSKADMWMLGCVIYTLMFFKHPFCESTKLAICAANFSWPEGGGGYSKNLENVVRNLLTPDPSLRLGVKELLIIFENWGAEVKLNRMAEDILEESKMISDKTWGRGRDKEKERRDQKEKEKKDNRNSPSVKQGVEKKKEQNGFGFDFGVFEKKKHESTPNQNQKEASGWSKFENIKFTDDTPPRTEAHDIFADVKPNAITDQFAAFNIQSNAQAGSMNDFLDAKSGDLKFKEGVKPVVFDSKVVPSKEDLLKLDIK